MKDGMKLHAQIMNLPATPVKVNGNNYAIAYKEGHRDARHAAAELAVAADALADAARAVLEWRVDTPLRGDLRDNAKSRDALRALADAAASLERHNKDVIGA